MARCAKREPKAAAQRRSVGHDPVDSRVTCQAHTRRRTSRTGCPAIRHSVSAIAIAAYP